MAQPLLQGRRRNRQARIFDFNESNRFVRAAVKDRSGQVDEAHGEIYFSRLENRKGRCVVIEDRHVDETDVVEKRRGDGIHFHARVRRMANEGFKILAKLRLPRREKTDRKPLRKAHRADEKNDDERQTSHAVSITLRRFLALQVPSTTGSVFSV